MGKLAPQILPPFLMLGLVAVPFLPFVFAFWVAGLVFAVVSVVSLSRMARARRRGQTVEAWRATRPALTLILFTGVAAYAYQDAQAESEAANGFARALARDMQAACDRDRKCPAAPLGWEADEWGRSRGSHEGRRIDYKVLPSERTSFRITVHHPLDSLRDFEGGVGKAVVEREAIR